MEVIKFDMVDCPYSPNWHICNGDCDNCSIKLGK